MLSFQQWKSQFAYIRNTAIETTMEEAMLDFFYNGLTTWINSCGYFWLTEDPKVAKSFLNFCYNLEQTLKAGEQYNLQLPQPNHRNLPEDLDTFQAFADSFSFTEFLSNWAFYDQIIGNRLDNLIVDFCYNWVDVERGTPGRWTQTTIEMNEGDISDDERAQNNLPDGNWSRRKHDLY
jgi:hypothetical protein